MGKRAKAFWYGVFRGVASPAETFTVNVYTYPHNSAEEAMRGDWVRVGDEIRGAMKRLEKQNPDVKAAA